MCWICEREGTVGPGYKTAQREIRGALAAWRKSCGPSHYGYRYGDHVIRFAPDRTTAPRERAWREQAP